MKRLSVLLCLALIGCGGDSTDDEETGETIGAEIAEDYKNQMDKAENVEQQLLDKKSNIDEALGDVEEETDD